MLRLLLGIGALLPEVRFETDHPGSLGRRPNADLLAALASLGMQSRRNGPDGLLPITLRGGPPLAARSASPARVARSIPARCSISRRCCPRACASRSPTACARPSGAGDTARAGRGGHHGRGGDDLRSFMIGGQRYRAREYVVPGDVPSAAALAWPPLSLRQPAQLATLDDPSARQRALIAALEAFGAPADTEPHGVLALGAATQLHGAALDGDAMIDSVPVLVALACLAEGESRFENVATLRLKESDRIGDLCAELRRAGCDVEPLDGRHLVRGRPEGIAGGVTVRRHDDHRLAQALAIVALRSRARADDHRRGAVAKSYPASSTICGCWALRRMRCRSL